MKRTTVVTIWVACALIFILGLCLGFTKDYWYLLLSAAGYLGTFFLGKHHYKGVFS